MEWKDYNYLTPAQETARSLQAIRKTRKPKNTGRRCRCGAEEVDTGMIWCDKCRPDFSKIDGMLNNDYIYHNV